MSATAESEEASDEVSEFTSIFRYFLLTFAGIALFVGAFVIFNTFSITVAQRTREFATLRTIGASRRQVLGSVILESLVIGLLASLDRARPRRADRGGDRGTVRRASGSSSRPRTGSSRSARSIVALIVGVGVTLVGRALPGDPRDARAADRRRARGRDAARSPASPRSCHGSRGSSWSARSVILGRAMFVGRAGHRRPAALDRRWRASALPRAWRCSRRISCARSLPSAVRSDAGPRSPSPFSCGRSGSFRTGSCDTGHGARERLSSRVGGLRRRHAAQPAS